MNETPLSLLDRLRSQPDDDSWHILVDLYTPLIRGWVGRFGVSASDLDDILQEVLATLVRELPGFDHSGRRGAFRRWVRAIAVNRLRNHWRDRPDGQGMPADLDLLAHPESELSRHWDREHDEHVARRLMERIEPEFAATTWRSFRRQVLDGARAADVAEELGVSVNAVLIAKSRVLRRLREIGAGLID